MNAPAYIVLVAALIAGAVRAEDCPAPTPDPSAEMLRRYDTPQFRAELRRGHAWRDSSGFVGEYYSRLELAAFLGDAELVKKLVSEPFVPQDTLLSAASLSIYYGHREVLALLFDVARLSPDATFDDRVSLMALAAGAGHADVLREFIHRKANMYARNGDALVAAIKNHQQQSVATLLAAGFDPSRARTSNGLSPIELARKLKDPCIEKLLKDSWAHRGVKK